MTRAEAFTPDPTAWIEVYLEDLPDPEDLSFYHVTTRASAVREAGELRSRAALAKDKVVGLGGGAQNQASGYVSFVYTRDRAEWLARAIGLAARAARNAIPAHEVARELRLWTDFPRGEPWSTALDDTYDRDEEAHADFEEAVADAFDLVDERGGVLDDFAGWLDRWRPRIDRAFSTGRRKYELIQRFETVLEEFIDRWQHLYASEFAAVDCRPIVGFTAPYAAFAKIDPDDIAIVRAAVRIRAPVDYVPAECELRFRPEDVRVLSVEAAGAALAG